MRAVYKSPIGLYEAIYERDTLLSLSFVPSGAILPPEDAFGREVFRQLDEYFAGTRRVFDLPIRMQGSDFQVKVWRGLMDIPYGETWCYGRLARHIGRPGASRAVGNANGKNRLNIIVPCHRVIRSDGSIGGYTGADTDTKRQLLMLEGAIMSRT